MMRRENGRVLIDLDLSEDEFELLIFAVGVAAGRGRPGKDVAGSLTSETLKRCVRLADKINEGNPNWTAYNIDNPKAE
jgi:hypothetical protein